MITIPVEIGDVILTGKFKNHKVTVQEIGIDDYGLPTVNGKGIMKIRVQKLMPKKVEEMNTIKEAPAQNIPKIQKLVDEVNALIKSALDSDGDPLMVVDNSGTWEEPMIYEPVVYSNGRLKFTYTEPYSGNKKKVDVVNSRDMEFEGIPMLRDLSKWYKKAIKQAGSTVSEDKVTMIENNVNSAVVDKLEKLIQLYAGSKLYSNAELGRNILKAYKQGRTAEDLVKALEVDSSRPGGGGAGAYDDYIKALKQAVSTTNESVTSNSNTTSAFLNSLDKKTKDEILSNIAKHYGISNQQAYEEVTDEEAESLMDYVTGSIRPTVSLLFNKFREKMKSTNESRKSRLSKKEVSAITRFIKGRIYEGIDNRSINVKIKKENGTYWFFLQHDNDDEENITNVGFETIELARHAARMKGFNIVDDKDDKQGDSFNKLPDSAKPPKPDNREKTPNTEKPKEIDLGKEKSIKLEESIKRLIRKEIANATGQKKKKSLAEGVSLTPKIRKALTELEECQKILAKANAEIEAIKKKYGLDVVQKKADDLLKVQLWDFLEELKKDETRIVKLKGIVLKINRHQASPATYEYEKVLDFVLTQVNQDVKAKILAELKATEKIGKTKANISFVPEAFGSVWDSIKNFFSRFIPALKAKGEKIDTEIEDLEQQLSEIE